MADRFPEAEMVLDDELLYDDTARRSTFMRRQDDRVDQIVHEGEVLAGKYRVERIPGRSGLGVVVQVRHMELGQEVTLKFLVPDACAYPEFVQRFVREARSAVKIQGEHVARVTDVGRLESGAPYMVREFLRGPDLAEVVKVRGPLPIEEAVDYVIQASEGVAEGHALGVVHRNLRPTTLVVTRRSDGTPLVKVLDFAAAESLHVDPFTERSVSLVGTSAIMASLPYLSPEQIRDPHDVDVRADIYALGAILYELLTGFPVHAADSAPGLLAAVAADAAQSVRNLRSDVPGELDHVVLRCLAKNRAIRYANLAELALALRPFASDDAQASVDRISRLARLSQRSGASSQPRASMPPVLAAAQAPAAPFPPSPSAAPQASGRGPSGTLVIPGVDAPRPSARVREIGNEDVTTINPYSSYAAPVVITQPLATPSSTPPSAPPSHGGAIGQTAISHTPKPPPLRSPSVPPPLRTSPPPPPVSQEPRVGSIPPPRSSVSGMTRSWAVPDEPVSPKLARGRLIGIGAVAAAATLAAVLAWRVSARPPAQAAAAPPARVEVPAPPPAAAAAPLPATEPSAASSSPTAIPVPSASAAVAVAVAAPLPAPPPAPVAATPAPQPAPRAAAPRRPALKAQAEGDYWDAASSPAPRPAKPAPVAEKVARVPSPAPGLFDDPR